MTASNSSPLAPGGTAGGAMASALATAASASRINLVLQQANDSAARALLLYGASTNNPLAANQIGTEFRAGASVTINTAETGLASGATRYYWTRARDQWGNLSDFSPSATATTS